MHKLIGCFGAALVMACATSTVTAATNHWIQSLGGSWHDRSNWSLGSVPTSADEAIIDAPGDYVVTVNEAAAVHKVQLGGAPNGTAELHMSSRVTYAEFIVQTNGVLQTSGGAELNRHYPGKGLSVHGTWRWLDGVSQMNGPAHIESTGQLQFEGTDDKQIGSIENYGTLVWNCSGAWVQQPYHTFNNYGHIDLRTHCRFVTEQYFSMENYGTISCPPGSAVTFDAGGAEDATYAYNIAHRDATSTVAAGGVLTFSGKHAFVSATFNGPGTIELEGRVSMLHLITANTLVKAAAINRIWFATWTGSGALEWTSGTMDGHIWDGHGATVISNDFTMRIVGDWNEHPHVMNFHTITNLGTIEWDCRTLNATNAAIHNQGTVIVRDYAQFFGTGNFYNSGTLLTEEDRFSYMEFSENWTFHSTGTLRAAAGTGLYLNGRFMLNTGTLFDGPGTVVLNQGNFGGSGTVTVNTLVEVTGNLTGDHTWTGSGVLRTSYGATIRGSLSLADGFNFQILDTLPIDGSLTNKGVMVWPSTGIEASNGEFHNEGTLIIDGYGYTTGSGNLYNTGTILATNTAFLEVWEDWTLHNSGTFSAGTDAHLYLSGNYLLDSGTVFDGPGMSVLYFGSFGGSGTITANDRVDLQARLTGDHVWTGPGVLQSNGGGAIGGSTVFSNDFHVEFTGGTVRLSNGTVTNQGIITVVNQTLDGDAGTFYNEGVIEISSSLEIIGDTALYNSGTIKNAEPWSGMMWVAAESTFKNSGYFFASADASLVLSGNYLLDDGTTFDGPGRTVMDSGRFGGTGTITVNGTAELSGNLTGRHVWAGPGVLQSYGGSEFSGNTLFSNDFEFRSHGGTFTVSGSLTNRGTMLLSQGTISGSNGKVSNEGLTLISDSAELAGIGNWFNSGRIAVIENGHAQFYVADSWTFQNSGTFFAGAEDYLELAGSYLLNDGSTFDGDGVISLRGRFGGSGTIQVPGFTQLDGSAVGDHTWTGTGKLEWLGGDISGNTLFSNGFTVSIPHLSYMPSIGNGSLTNRGTMGLVSAELHSSGGQFRNEGTMVVVDFCELNGSGSLYNSGTIKAQRDFNGLLHVGDWAAQNSGTFRAEENALLEVAGSHMLRDGSTFEGPGRVYLSSGTIGGAGTITVNGVVELGAAFLAGDHVWAGPGLLEWTAGGFTGDGSTVFADNFRVHAHGAASKLIAHSLTNLGTIHWSDSFDLTNDAALYNLGTFKVAGDVQFISNGSFHNVGVYEQTGNVIFEGDFHNTGKLTLSSGFLVVRNSYNAGAHATHQFTVSGTTPGADFGQLQTANLNASGDLSVTLSGGFTGVKGDELDLITFETRSGTFGNVSIPEADDESAWRAEYKSNSFTLFKGFAETPIIAVELQDKTLPVGTNHTFSVVASGTGTLRHQWAFNGINLVNATNASLTLTNLQPDATGVYSVKVTNSGGSDSSSATLTVLTPPSITTHPTGKAVVAGSVATFGVAAEGDQLIYQWYFNGSTISGGTNAILTLANAQPAHAGTYHVTVENEVGEQRSSNAVLIVNLPPRITAGPATQTVVSGSNVLFSVEADGTGVLHYEWQHNGTPISGGTTTSLQLTNVQVTAAGTYTVSVKSDFGSASASATLVVRQTPFFITQPIDESVVLGSNAVFTVQAGGEDPLTYRWHFNGTALPGATNASLALTNIQTTNAGTYHVIVENEVGFATSSNALLTVNVPATIITGPEDRAIVSGSNVLFVVEAYGTGVLQYQWQHNGTPIAGETMTSILLTNVQAATAGTYTVSVTNDFGSASASATLVVRQTPYIITQPINHSTVLGSNAVFTVEAGGENPLTYRWHFEGTALTEATNASLSITNIQATNAGTYYVVVENEVGSVTSSNALLTVNIPATIIAGPEDQTVISGEDVTFSVAADGTDILSYQWQHNGVDLSGATAHRLLLTNVQKAASGTYTVLVTNAFGSTAASAVLTVQQTPFIVAQPNDLAIVLGSNALFSVEAGGDAPLSYQWYFNGSEIAGTTNSICTVDRVHASNGGGYHVVVSNLYGAVTSRVATLTITYTNNPFLQAAGIYNGLFHETDAVRHHSAGFLTMSLKTNSSFSGKLLLDGNSVSFSGKFQTNGGTNRTVLRSRLGKSPVTVSLQVDFGTDKVIGTVSASNWVANLVADRSVYNNTNLATNFAGKYTMLIPGADGSSLSPSGFGYGTITVRTNGRLSFSGMAADKHSIKQSTVIAKDGSWPLFTLMYRSASNVLDGAVMRTNKDYRGFMLGWLATTGTSGPSGTVSWIKTGWTNQFYAAGFTNETEVLGSTFTTPAKGTRVMAITNGIVSFFDGNLAASISHTFTLRTNNSVLTTHRTNLTLSISTSAGSFRGSFRDPASGAFIPFYGALLQNEKFGAGFFLGTNEAGVMQLQKE